MKEKDEKQILGMLGFAAKTGKIVLGQKALKSYITNFQSDKILIFASDRGESVDSLIKKCKSNNVPFVKLNCDKKTIGKAVGKAEVSAVGIIESTFVSGIKKIIYDDSTGGI